MRPKNGPPLTNIVHKVNQRWLYQWLKNPKSHDPTAQMPNLQLEDAEIRAIISYLTSIADTMFPKVSWNAYLLKDEEDWSDEDWVQLDLAISGGEKVWRRSRCTICHMVEGRGGFVNVRVGKSLSKIAGKVKRDWVFQWIKEPQSYFPETFMPRYRLSDDLIKDLAVYLTYADPFLPYEEEQENIDEISPSLDVDQIAFGKRTIELSRCILCHDVKGIREMMPVAKREDEPSGGFFGLLNDVRCLTCHTIAGKGGDYAPELTFEGSKLKFGWITDFLAAPDIIRPLSQQMPRFNLTEQEAETAARFIEENFLRADMNLEVTINANPTRSKIEAGEKIYSGKGCHACHAIQGEGGAVGPDLTTVGDRLEPEYIFFHLKHPNRAVPFSPEPNYGLSDEEALALTYFLMSRRKQ
ncbi:MAG: c-type cytochrome [Bacteroidota bacterium]